MITFVVLCALAVSLTSASSYGGSRCFSCNYAPSGYGYHNNGYAGAPQCALRRKMDRDSLDQWDCGSGKCFVRLDKNGLIYRGCADPYNLPYGVDTYKQCEYQAGSLWTFCDGDLCNTEQIGKKCGQKPTQYNAPIGKNKGPCDGKCYGNPSGLFPGYTKDSFIQCGCGNDHYGKTCTCCVPFHLKCPYGTMFDDYQKKCVYKKSYHK